IYDALVARFGHGNIFMDVDSIGLGRDFVEVIDERLAQADVMLVVVGPHWTDAEDKRGNRRLDDPHDFPRLQLHPPLPPGTGVPVSPVPAAGADRPTTDQLPDSPAAFPRRNAETLIDGRHWASSMNDLVEELDRFREALPSSEAPQTGATSPATPAPQPERQI